MTDCRSLATLGMTRLRRDAATDGAPPTRSPAPAAAPGRSRRDCPAPTANDVRDERQRGERRESRRPRPEPRALASSRERRDRPRPTSTSQSGLNNKQIFVRVREHVIGDGPQQRHEVPSMPATSDQTPIRTAAACAPRVPPATAAAPIHAKRPAMTSPAPRSQGRAPAGLSGFRFAVRAKQARLALDERMRPARAVRHLQRARRNRGAFAAGTSPPTSSARDQPDDRARCRRRA